MSEINFSVLQSSPRLLIEATLKPLQGDRFQPTGFADLGAARYALADGTEMLLVESAQSVANHLEAAIFDEASGDLIKQLSGLPYIKINISNKGSLLGTTSTLKEAHRLNSGYLWTLTPDKRMEDFRANLRKELGMKPKGDAVDGPLNMPQIAKAVFTMPMPFCTACFWRK